MLAATWIENSAQVDVPVALEDCWNLWEDRERIPNWMPWIASVIVSTDRHQQTQAGLPAIPLSPACAYR